MSCRRTFHPDKPEPTHDGVSLGKGVFGQRNADGTAVVLCVHDDPSGQDSATARVALGIGDMGALSGELLGNVGLVGGAVEPQAESEPAVMGSIAPAPEPPVAALGIVPAALEPDGQPQTASAENVPTAPSEPVASENHGAPPA